MSFSRLFTTPLIIAGFITATSAVALAQGAPVPTEVMITPANGTQDQWIELHNPNAAPFDLTGYVFADDDTDPGAANIASGSIPGYGSAVLFNGAASSSVVFDAKWGGTATLIAVDPWPEFDASDQVGLWANYSDYGSGTGAARFVIEWDNGGSFPTSPPGSSLHLERPTLDPTVGANWRESLPGTFDARINTDNDVGSPGLVPWLVTAGAGTADPGTLGGVLNETVDNAMVYFDTALAGVTVTIADGAGTMLQNGPDNLTITGFGDPAQIVISGAPNFTVFQLEGTTRLTLMGLTIADTGVAAGDDAVLHVEQCIFRDATSGSAIALQQDASATAIDCTFIDNSSPTAGPAVAVLAGTTFVATRCRFIDNRTTLAHAGAVNIAGSAQFSDCVFRGNIAGASGGAIHALGVDGDVTLSGCEFSGNASRGGTSSLTDGGGAIFVGLGATLDAVNTTISGNASHEHGGAIKVTDAASSVTLTHCTITDNTCDSDGDNDGDGGGVFVVDGTVTVGATIIAGNADATASGPDHADISGAGFTSNGNNIIGDGTGATGLVDGSNGDNVGTAGAIIDPMLQRLYPNGGGETWTHRPLPGSPAIDAIFTSATATDQRGVSRPADGDDNAVARYDIGAFEADYDFIAADATALTTAVAAAVTSGTLVDIIFSAGGVIEPAAPISIPTGVNIYPPATGTLEIDCGQISGGDLFDVTLGAHLTVEGLRITGVNTGRIVIDVLAGSAALLDADVSELDGGGMRVGQLGRAWLLDTTMIANGAGDGPAVTLTAASFDMRRSRIEGFVAGGNGGAVDCAAGVVTITDSTIADNSATAEGGGIYLSAGSTAEITRSTIFENSAGGKGGGISFRGDELTITNSTLAGNNSESNGGGIFQSLGTMTLTHVTITSNAAYSAGGSTSTAGGGFRSNNNTVVITNSIVAGNIDGSDSPETPDVSTNAVSSGGGNIIGDVATVSGFDQPGDQTGTAGAELLPNLSRPVWAGGYTRVYLLLPGSPAIDTGADAGVDDDQRGVARDADPDAGAVEFTVNALPTVELADSPAVFTPGLDTTIPLDAAAALTDGDGYVDNVQVAIIGNYVQGEDELAFTPSGGVTGVWDPANGTLALTGFADVDTFRTVLRSVTYANTAAAAVATIEVRTILVSADDGLAVDTDTRDIAINAAPTVTVSIGGVAIADGETVTLTAEVSVADLDIELAVADANGDTVSLAATISNPAVFGLVETEFETGAQPTAYIIRPQTGAFNVDGTTTIDLVVNDGITTGTASFSVSVTLPPPSGGGGGNGGGSAIVVLLALVCSLGLALRRRP
jgi:hypothetical protein